MSKAKKSEPPKLQNVATYRRVSSASQTGEDCYGLDRQQADLDRYVAEHGLNVVPTFEDVGSGAQDDTGRPGIYSLLHAASGRSFEAVVVPAWGRLARDSSINGWIRHELKKRGEVVVLSATQQNGVDPATKAMEAFLAVVAEIERSMLKQRLIGARKVKRLRGGYIGGNAPYGTLAVAGTKVLHSNVAEFETLREIKVMRDAGSTLQQIADAMNTAGRNARNGGKWYAGTIHRALKGFETVSRVVA